MPDTPFGEEHYDLLLAQMVRSPTIRDLAVEMIEPRHFTDQRVGGTPVQGIVFSIIKSYAQEHGLAPDGAVFLVELERYLTRYFNSESKRQKVIAQSKRFLALIDLTTENSEPLARKVLQHIVESCVFKTAVDEAIHEYKETGALSVLRDNILEVESRQSVMHGGLSTNHILDLEIEEAGERVSTQLPWLDVRFGKGAGPALGSALGIIAPQGHGKTTLGIQMAVSQALVGRHALLVLAEEGMSLQMRCKIFGCALGLDWTLIEAAPPPKFVDKVIYAVRDARIDSKTAGRKMAHVSEYLHVLDLVAKNAVPDALEVTDGEIQLLRSKGKKPTYVYVDWAGIIAAAREARGGLSKREELLNLAYGLSNQAARHNSILAVSHQMSPADERKGPFASHTVYCGAECKQFTEPFKYVFVLNPREPNQGYQIMQVPKSRNDEPPEKCIMQLRGELASFYDMSSKWEIKGKRIAPRRTGPEGRMPTERR